MALVVLWLVPFVILMLSYWYCLGRDKETGVGNRDVMMVEKSSVGGELTQKGWSGVG